MHNTVSGDPGGGGIQLKHYQDASFYEQLNYLFPYYQSPGLISDSLVPRSGCHFKLNASAYRKTII